MVTKWRVLPEGMGPDDVELHLFAVYVEWRGTYRGRRGGGWAVTNPLRGDLDAACADVRAQISRGSEDE